MSATLSQAATGRFHAEGKDLCDTVFNISILIGCIFALCVLLVNRCLRVKFLNGSQGRLAPFVAFGIPVMWSLPVETFLLYHRVAFPTWMTFGYQVAFGGLLPNVCDNVARGLYPFDDGGWPCFLPGLEGWLAKVCSPHGWRYLLQADSKVLLCLFFFLTQVLVCTYVVGVLREHAQQRDWDRKRRNAAHKRWADQRILKKRCLEAGTFHKLDCTSKQ